MARRGVLTQQLNAIESLASANLVCLDKTGTLLVLEAPSRRRSELTAGMCAALGAVYLAVLAIAPARAFFELSDPTVGIAATALVAAAASIGALAVAGFAPSRFATAP